MDDEKTLRTAVSDHPDDRGAVRALAIRLHTDGAYVDAAEQYDVYMQDGWAADAFTLSIAGAAHLAADQPKRAAELLSRAADGESPQTGTLRRLAWARLVLGQPVEAIATYDLAIAADADDRAARVGRGLAVLRAGRLDEGLRETLAALKK